MKLQRLNQIILQNRNKDQRLTMIAIIMKGGNILSIGVNDYSRIAFPNKRRNGYKKWAGIHSELQAINKLNKDQLRGSKIIVYGISKAGNLPVSSRPCENCYNAIKAVGIKKIIYYDKDGNEFSETVN